VRIALRLWCCYGVVLELHGQNTLLLLSEHGSLEAIVCREVADSLEPEPEPEP
jgi:siderophore synthetase component